MSNLSGDSLVNLLTFKKNLRTLIITVGNRFRADDGVGPYIASFLKSSSWLSIIDAGYNPENIIDQAIKLSPRVIIFIDAADFKGIAGEIRLIDAKHIPETTLSTHSVPLPVVSKILEEDTKAEIYFIGIQPKRVEFKEGLSPEVKLAADGLIEYINKHARNSFSRRFI